MSPRSKLERTSHTTRLLIASATSVIVAWVGAWQTTNATSSNTTPAEVRQIVQQESPINGPASARLYSRLRSVDTKVDNLRIQEAVNETLLRQLVNQSKGR